MIKEVKIVNYRDYVPEKSSNGGCYYYTESYDLRDGKYRKLHGTSAEFSFCAVCGVFGDHDCDWNLDAEYISEKELHHRISNLSEDEEITKLEYLTKEQEIEFYFKNIIQGKRTRCIKLIEEKQKTMRNKEFSCLLFDTKTGNVFTSYFYKEGEYPVHDEHHREIGRFTKHKSPQKVMNAWL